MSDMFENFSLIMYLLPSIRQHPEYQLHNALTHITPRNVLFSEGEKCLMVFIRCPRLCSWSGRKITPRSLSQWTSLRSSSNFSLFWTSIVKSSTPNPRKIRKIREGGEVHLRSSSSSGGPRMAPAGIPTVGVAKGASFVKGAIKQGRRILS